MKQAINFYDPKNACFEILNVIKQRDPILDKLNYTVTQYVP